MARQQNTKGQVNSQKGESLTYSDGLTPAVTNSYNRLGQVVSQTQTLGGINVVKTTAFSSLGLPLTESWTGGPLDGLIVTNGYDSLQRRTTVGLSNYSASVASYGYDRASRLAGVTNGSAFAAYTYSADRGQWTKLQLGLSGTNRLTTSRVYDKADRQVSLTNASSSTDVSGFTFNTAGQMTRRDEPDGTYWIYTYDSLGQVTSGKKYWSDNSPVAGQQFEYAFDDIGNRNSSASGGDASGSNLRSVSYTKNLLNQYEGRNNPSAITVIGSAATNATVTVNLNSTVRKGEYWWGEATATNSYYPAYVGITNVAVIKGGGTNGTDLVSTNTGALLWPVSSETFTNDLDGNLTADSLWTYTWDGENRLIRKESQFAVPLDFRRRLDMAYDAGSRRIGQTISTWTNSAYASAKTKRFVCDGWNLLAELDAGKTLVQAYVWGTDLSGSLTGAGGVGGLLLVNTGSASHGYAYNSNGDVRSLVSLTDGSQSAAYEYGPFGELIRSSGTMALSNPFRFSTKYQDEESGLIYYGYRYYDAKSGRWLGRDPIQEQGGLNLYAFALNRPLTVLDILGLANYRIGSPTEPPMTFDEDFVYDPNAKATDEDHWQWKRWWFGLHLYGEMWRGRELEDATRAYAHYRDGTGTDLKINYPKAYREDTNVRGGVNNEIAAAQADAERLAATGGARFTMTGDAERLGDPTTENWQKTIGKHYIWGHADVEACADKFTMTITIHEKDRYNFNRGAADIATGLPDNANGRFAILGWAKSFITKGEVVKKVTWKKGEVGATTKIEDPSNR